VDFSFPKKLLLSPQVTSCISDLLNLPRGDSSFQKKLFLITEAWSCYHSNNGQDGARDHVGSILFTDNKTATAKTTRSARTGEFTLPLRGCNTYITHAANVWNRSGTLRNAPTKAARRRH
jgi:hypothetical protein